MKKLLLFLIILTLFSCVGTDVQEPENEFDILSITIENDNQEEKTSAAESNKIVRLSDIEDLGIKEIKKSKKSDWYSNFSDFRDNYKQIKINSDVFLGIGGIYLTQEDAMQAARSNGETNIKNSLAISSSSKENFGNIIDSVLEIHRVRYKGEITTGYKYNLLLEVNKVSAFALIDEKNKEIEDARRAIQRRISEAEEYEFDGDLALKTKSYARAIILYRNAKAIYEETDSIEQEDKVNEKIFTVKELQAKEKMDYEIERKSKLREINELEIKRNLNEFQLERLKELYLDTRQIKKAEETESRLQSLLLKKDIISKQAEMREFIRSFTAEAYIETNYTTYYNNYKKYYPSNQLDTLLLKKDIIDEISEDSLVVLFDKSYFRNKYLNLFTNVLSYKYDKFIKIEVKEDSFDTNLVYKYKSWNVISINSINLVAEKGRYGYRGVFSVTYNYADFKNGLSNLVSIPATRSRHTDHETPEQALTQVIDNELSGR